MTIQPIDNHQE